MATYESTLAALGDFRADLLMAQHSITTKAMDSAASLGIRSPYRLNAHPLQNIHATGVGIRFKDGKPIPDDYVIKVYVFHKVDVPKSLLGVLGKAHGGVQIDVEELPIVRAPNAMTTASTLAPTRPIVGGVQIQSQGATAVGTLGCFVKQGTSGAIFALSNNHVMADVNQLPTGKTLIDQPASSSPGGVFAQLSDYETLNLATPGNPYPGPNRIDAAVALITDRNAIKEGIIAGIPKYDPTLKAAAPGMEVTKSGADSGVTVGTIASVGVTSVQMNYGTPQAPLLCLFDGMIMIQGSDGPFSSPGDSGSVIVEVSSGKPVALLMGAADVQSCACDLTTVCKRFSVVPA